MALHPFPAMNGGPEQVTHHFRFQINSTSDPDNIVGAAQAVSDIVRDSAGVFSVTFAEKYPTMVSCQVSVQGAVTFGGQPTSYTSSTGVLVLTTFELDGANAAGDPTDDVWVCVDVTFCRRSQLAPSVSI